MCVFDFPMISMWLLCGYCVANVWLLCGYCVDTEGPSKSVVFLNDWRFNAAVLPYSLQCLWYDGSAVPVARPQNMLLRRLKVHSFRHRAPKLQQSVPYCPTCFAKLVLAQGTPQQ